MRVVEWQENITESGIQLGEFTKVMKRGEILSTHAFPAQSAGGQMGIITIVVVRTFEKGQIISMPAEVCKFVGDFVPIQGNDEQFVEPLKKSE